MNKMTQRLLAGAVAFALANTCLAQDVSSRLLGGAPAQIEALAGQVPGQSASPNAAGGAPARVNALAGGVFTQATPTPAQGGTPARLDALVDGNLVRAGLPEPLPPAPDLGVGGGVLEALPKPRDLPASLFAPPPPASTAPIVRIDAPYFIPDPLLDPAQLGAPGWFAGAEVQIVKTHLIPGLSNVVQPGKFISNSPVSGPAGPGQHTVALPASPLNWTASPRVYLGYRLPAGFGEFMVAYRHLDTSGSGMVPGASHVTALSSRFALDMIDFDYNSRELSLGPQWDMKWTIGLRTLFLFFDSTFNQPIDLAAAGNGVFEARNSNNFFGLGPHAAVELSRHLGDSGWSLYARGDFAGTFDYVSEGFQTQSTTLGPHGRPLFGETRAFGHQAAPMINGRLGLTWQPSPVSGTRLFVGYQYEVMWDLDRVPQSTGSPAVPPSLGQFWDQGIVLQATFRY